MTAIRSRLRKSSKKYHKTTRSSRRERPIYNAAALPLPPLSSSAPLRRAAGVRENEPARRAPRRNRMQAVGVIRQLIRYPVKSMQGEALTSAALTLQGFAEDRRYAFVQATSRSAFPWLTARELPELLRYRTSVEKAGTPEVAVTVATAHGENWPIESDNLRKA